MSSDNREGCDRGMPDHTGDHGLFEFGMRLIVKACSTSESVTCEVVGKPLGKHLTLRILDDNYPAEFERKGESLAVKYNGERYSFNFPGQVVQFIDSSDKFLFIEILEGSKDGDLQSNEQINCFIPVQLSSGETVFQAAVAKISALECLCTVREDNFPDISLEKNTLIIVRFSDELSVDGKICFIERRSHRYEIGVSFQKIDEENQRKLTELIPSLQF